MKKLDSAEIARRHADMLRRAEAVVVVPVEVKPKVVVKRRRSVGVRPKSKTLVTKWLKLPNDGDTRERADGKMLWYWRDRWRTW